MSHIDNALFYITNAIAECKGVMGVTPANDEKATEIYEKYLKLRDIELQIKRLTSIDYMKNWFDEERYDLCEAINDLK